jgi:hypothetical protein
LHLLPALAALFMVPFAPVLAEVVPPELLGPVGLLVGALITVAVLYRMFTASQTAGSKAKDDQIALLKDELDKANARYEQERDQRIEDARTMASIAQAARVARGAMNEVAEGLTNDDTAHLADPYSDRLRVPRRRAPRG